MIEAPRGWLAGVALGDSIALAGACMTVVAFGAATDRFEVDVSAESLAVTAGLGATGVVNLEKALRAGDRLDGHLVSGHVDGVGTVRSFERRGESFELVVLAPRELARFLAVKGSLAVDGTSLTVNRVDDLPDGCAVSINLIPHTADHTTLGRLRPGQRVNLEIDTIARYVERMLAARAPAPA